MSADAEIVVDSFARHERIIQHYEAENAALWAENARLRDEITELVAELRSRDGS